MICKIIHISSIYIYIHIWYGGMCISNTNDNVWHWWRYRSLLLFPLLCCWCHSLAPQDQAPFPPTSQLSYKYDCWWGSWVKWLQLTSWLHTTKKNVYQIDQESCVSLYLYQGLGERFHQVSFPNQRCDNLILPSPLIWKVWSWRWVAIYKHDPQAERVRAGRARFRFCWRSNGKIQMYISLKEFQDEWPWTGVCP